MRKKLNIIVLFFITLLGLSLTIYSLSQISNLRTRAQSPKAGSVVIPQNPTKEPKKDSIQLQTFPFITLTPTPTPTPIPTPTSVPPKETDSQQNNSDPGNLSTYSGQVTIIGDSITVISKKNLQTKLPNAIIDGVSSRSFNGSNPEGAITALRRLKGKGQIRPILVFAIGTNGGLSSANIAQLLTEAPDSKIILVTIYNRAVPGYTVSTNAVIKAAANGNPGKISFADWNTIPSGTPGLMAGDGFHPNSSGAEAFADVIAKKIAGTFPQTGTNPVNQGSGGPPPNLSASDFESLMTDQGRNTKSLGDENIFVTKVLKNDSRNLSGKETQLRQLYQAAIAKNVNPLIMLTIWGVEQGFRVNGTEFGCKPFRSGFATQVACSAKTLNKWMDHFDQQKAKGIFPVPKTATRTCYYKDAFIYAYEWYTPDCTFSDSNALARKNFTSIFKKLAK